MKNVMKKAHEITKKIIRKDDSYRATFRLALSLAHSLIKKGIKEMVELVGTEKQVKWAKEIRETLNTILLEIKDADIKRKQRKNKSFEESSRKMNDAIKMINSKEESTFFIDNFKTILYGPRKDKLYDFAHIIIEKQIFENGVSAITSFAIKEIYNM